MKAVIVSPSPDSDRGGTERFCRELSALLRSLDFDVRVVGPPTPVPRPVARHGGAALQQRWTELLAGIGALT